MFEIKNIINQNIFRKDTGAFRDWVIWLVEFVGTFLMVFMIFSPAAFKFTDGHMPAISIIFSTFSFRALYVSFFIYLLVVIFRKISSNFNPAVTLVHMARKDDDLVLGIGKIVSQFIGAFCAAYFAQFLSFETGNWVYLPDGTVDNSLDAVSPILQIYNWWGNGEITEVANIPQFNNFDPLDHMSWWSFLSIFIEFVLTFFLLASVFMWVKRVTYRGRPVVIFLTLYIILSIGQRTNNIALNPARLIAASVVGEQFGGAVGTMEFIWMYLVGEILAVFLMIYIQMNPTTRKISIGAPQTQKSWAKYIGWTKMKTKMTSSGDVIIDWDEYVNHELKYLASELEIDNISKLNREELIQKIKEVELKRKEMKIKKLIN